MDATQVNYTTTEKELLAIYLLKKPDAKSRLIWWMLLLQEFNIEIKDKKGVENVVADHLSQLERDAESIPIRDEFSDEQILRVTHTTPWYADICNYLVSSSYPMGASKAVKERLESEAKYYIWDDPYLWRLCNDQFMLDPPLLSLNGRRRPLWMNADGPEMPENRVALSWKNEMPQQPMVFCEIFDVWGIDFIGPFQVSYGNSYILLAVDYVSKWVEAKATKTNDAKTIVDFVKSNIFYKFGVPKALISD
ncbi:Pro-Pol polyprotein, partial [Mucuna pruriens]